MQKQLNGQLQTIGDWLRFGASWFNQEKLFFGHGTDNAWDEAITLVLHALHLEPELGFQLGDKLLPCALTETEKKTILTLFSQRVVERLPAAYITRSAYYGGLDFYVDPRVLIPRSPLKEIIQKECQPWIDKQRVHRILDLGTGSGCLAILAALVFPTAKIDAIDTDSNALAVAKINLAKYQLTQQVNLIQSDLYQQLEQNSYDIILANPPYVDAADMKTLPSEYRHEPQTALASGVDGIDHMQKIIQQAPSYLTPHGVLFGEVGNSAEALERALPQLNFIWLELADGGEGVFVLTAEQLAQVG